MHTWAHCNGYLSYVVVSRERLQIMLPKSPWPEHQLSCQWSVIYNLFGGIGQTVYIDVSLSIEAVSIL